MRERAHDTRHTEKMAGAYLSNRPIRAVEVRSVCGAPVALQRLPAGTVRQRLHLRGCCGAGEAQAGAGGGEVVGEPATRSKGGQAGRRDAGRKRGREGGKGR